MKNTKIELDKKLENDLRAFKKVFDAVMREKIDFEKYANIVLFKGLEKLFNDTIPAGYERDAILEIRRRNPEVLYEIIASVLKSKTTGEQKKIKNKFKGEIRYIG